MRKKIIIYICDDETLFLEEEKKICESFFEKNQISTEYILGQDGQDVMACSVPIDLLLLDIDMPGTDGIKVKESLEKREHRPLILFITNHEERMREAFGTQVLGFVDKAGMQEQIPFFLQKLCGEISYSLIEGDNDICYDSREILYIQSAGKNYVRVFLNNERDTVIRATLNKLEEQLAEVDYIRVHREYLVNMRKIDCFRDGELEIQNTKIPISVRKKGSVKKAYTMFQRKMARYW